MYNIKLTIKNNKSPMEIITRTFILVEISAEMVGNSNGRLFSNENNRDLFVERWFTTLESIEKIFKH